MCNLQVSTFKVRLIVFPCFLRWLCRLRWAWRATSWPSPTTCLCTTTPNTGAELEDWTPQKEHRPTWNTVLKAGTKHGGSLNDLSLSPSLFFLSVQLHLPSPASLSHPLPPCLAPYSTPPLSPRYPSQTCALAFFLISLLLPPRFSLSSLVGFLSRAKRGESGS